MTENKRFKYTFEGIEDTLESDEEYKYTLCNKDGFQDLCEMLNELNDENMQLKSEIEKLSYANEDLLSEKRNWQRMSDEYCKLSEENEELKQCLNEAKNDEKQLGIDFMGFKMKLIEHLRIHYAYASEQRQKNLDNPLLAKAYDIIRYDIRKLAEEMKVDLE